MIILDVETTGLDPAKDEIVEWATIDLDWESGRVQYARSTICRPNKPIPERATTVHGLTDDLVSCDEKQIGIISLRRLFDIMPLRYFVAHNAKFDGGFCRATCDSLSPTFIEWYPEHTDRRGMPRRWICTRNLAREMLPGISGEKPYTLDNLRAKLDLPNVMPHTALGDCITVHARVLEIWKRCGKLTPEQMWEKSGRLML